MKHAVLIAKIGVCIAEKEPQEEVEKWTNNEVSPQLSFLSAIAALPFDDIGIFEYLRQQSSFLHKCGEQDAYKSGQCVRKKQAHSNRYGTSHGRWSAHFAIQCGLD